MSNQLVVFDARAPLQPTIRETTNNPFAGPSVVDKNERVFGLLLPPQLLAAVAHVHRRQLVDWT
jgi:hypothetical protein